MSFYCPECGTITPIDSDIRSNTIVNCILKICNYSGEKYKFIKIDKFMIEDHRLAALKRVALSQRQFKKSLDEKIEKQGFRPVSLPDFLKGEQS